MTHHTTTRRAALFADLPPTRAGLWTAVAMTQKIAAHLAGRPPAPGSENVDAQAVALQCGRAAQVLSSTVSGPADTSGVQREPAGGESRQADFDLGALTGGCIELAVEVLSNEHEPLSPSDILAITCAVSALCTARAASPGSPA